jgi:hypothetical protein
MTTNKKSLSRRVGTVVLLATVIATGGALSAGVSTTAQAGDGGQRCCFSVGR